MTQQSTVPSVIPIRRPAPVATVQGTLALDLEPRQAPPEVTAPRADRPVADVVPIDLSLRRGIEDWALRYAQAAVEIVGGDRPVTQLLRWTSREVYENLQRRAVLVARAGRHAPGQGRVQPVRPRVHGVHTCFVSPDAVEASVHVKYGPRSRAVAARFERRERRWTCTALEFA